MSEHADAIARLRAQRDLWIELDERRAVRLPLPGWQERLRMAGLPRIELLESLVGRVNEWRGFTWSDALGCGTDEMPFSADVFGLLLDANEPWLVRIVDAHSEATQKRAAEAEAVSGN